MRPAAPWAIIPLDLETLPDRLNLPQDARCVVLQFRLRGLVLGIAHQLPEAFPLTGGDLARLAALATGDTAALLLATELRPMPVADLVQAWERRPIPDARILSRLAGQIETERTRPAQLSASVVICTRRRPKDLAACLDAIADEIAAGRDVVVADNGPDPETEAVVRARPGVRYAPAPRPGLSHARNVGLAAARGEVAVFVDDDVRPEPGWITPLAAAFEPGIDVVCGLVLPQALETDAQIGFQYDLGFGGMGSVPLLYDQAFLDAAADSPPVWVIGAGANMAVRRRRALEIGGFDERIGPGAAGGCGDDSEYWRRVLEEGGRIVYQPLSVARHRHRRDPESFRQQARGYGLGHIVALFAQYGRWRDRRDLRRALLVMPAWMIRQALKAPLLGRPQPLAFSWISGYLAALPHLPLAFRAPPAQPLQVAGDDRDEAPR